MDCFQALREKEKNDWKNLTLDEKKKLYRASFCQTFAEMEAPTGEWKSVVGISLLGVSFALWIYIWMVKFGEYLPVHYERAYFSDMLKEVEQATSMHMDICT